MYTEWTTLLNALTNCRIQSHLTKVWYVQMLSGGGPQDQNIVVIQPRKLTRITRQKLPDATAERFC